MKVGQYILLTIFFTFFYTIPSFAEAFKSAGPSDGEAKVLYFLMLTGSLLAIALVVLMFASVAQWIYKEKKLNHLYYILAVLLILLLPATMFQQNALVPIVAAVGLSMLGWFVYQISEPDANFGKWFFQLLLALILFIILGISIVVITFLG